MGKYGVVKELEKRDSSADKQKRDRSAALREREERSIMIAANDHV